MVGRSLAVALPAHRLSSAVNLAKSSSKSPPSPPCLLHLRTSDFAFGLFGSKGAPTRRKGIRAPPVTRSTTRHLSCTSRRHRGHGSATTDNDSKAGTRWKRSPPRPAFLVLLSALGLAALAYRESARGSHSSSLNGETFTSCRVLSNEQVSPTSFVLTVSLPDNPNNRNAVADAWAHGLWSIEIKQPQLQVARNYTPLPSPPEQQPDTTLHFLVRRYHGGEVSTYLSHLAPGDEVELRGPHLGFDVARRLGRAGVEVVVLAGGTGVAPALQAARRLAAVEGASVRILWANRSAADCVGCPRLNKSLSSSTTTGLRSIRGLWSGGGGGGGARRGEQAWDEVPGPIVRQVRELEALFRLHGGSLDLSCVVDDEAGGRISEKDIVRLVKKMEPPTLLDESCQLHSQKVLERSTEHSEVIFNSSGAWKPCHCAENAGGSNQINTATGKNLFVVSGPDGFVSTYVGPKVWADGAERQGPVDGIIAKLMIKDAETWKDWLVLKQ